MFVPDSPSSRPAPRDEERPVVVPVAERQQLLRPRLRVRRQPGLEGLAFPEVRSSNCQAAQSSKYMIVPFVISGVQNSRAICVEAERMQSNVTTEACSILCLARVSAVSDSSNQPGTRSTRSKRTPSRSMFERVNARSEYNWPGEVVQDEASPAEERASRGTNQALVQSDMRVVESRRPAPTRPSVEGVSPR